ncbi:MAG: SIR2 family protein [Verrucomicrobiales bacterium]|nr:SIR2 family protein [Verrucomicrobiales bacterium]
MPSTAVDDLRKLIAERRIVVVVGSGVSRAVSGGEEVASWSGLLKNGVRKCRGADPRLDDAWEQRALGAIDSPDLDETLGAAELISRKLNAPDGGAFAGWLRETVGALKVRHPELLHAIAALGAPLVTTNYDGLLEKVMKLPAITWQDEGKVSRMLERAEDSAAVFHVHGYWDQPKSVVLGIRSYEEVRLTPHIQAVLRALAMTQSLLFVGCGDGLRDPNFGPFLTWLGSVNRSRETPHYRLALEKDVVGLVQEHPPDQRIQIVSYGEGHGDLLGFLQRLAPKASSTAAHAVSSTIAVNETLETLHAAVGAYLQRLAVRVSKLQLLGLGRGIQITLPIQEAYVPLRTSVTRQFEERRPGHSKDPLVAGGDYCEREIELARMFEVAAGSGHQGVLLLGDPGAGKTTGARQFCWRLLHRVEAGETPGLPAGCVPVFLRLRDLTPALLSGGLKAFIAEQVKSEALPEGEAQPGLELIALRKVLWIFDGLDEVVSEEARVHVCGWLRRWLEDRTQDWVLVTSRYQGYQGKVDLGPEFCRFHVQPLSAEQSAEFVRRWYQTVYRRLNPSDRDAEAHGTKEAEALLGLLSESAYRIGGLRDLPSNPLLLTILCLVHHEDHSLPRKRTDVYARCVRVLLESWRQETRQTQGVA